MKHLFFLILTFITSTTYAETGYTGIWKDNQGVFYSIHQTTDSIIVGELLNRFTVLSPLEQGSLYFTNNELDLAIMGYGFFILKADDGSYTYTRNGNFHISADNAIVNDKGERLVTEKQLPIPLDRNFSTEKPTATPLPCSTLVGCPAETRQIIIDPDGSISLRNHRLAKYLNSTAYSLLRFLPNKFIFPDTLLV